MKERIEQRVKVCIIERDRWSGPSVLLTKYFKQMDEAKSFCRDHNKQNNLPHTPEYYTVAENYGWTDILIETEERR